MLFIRAVITAEKSSISAQADAGGRQSWDSSLSSYCWAVGTGGGGGGWTLSRPTLDLLLTFSWASPDLLLIFSVPLQTFSRPSADFLQIFSRSSPDLLLTFFIPSPGLLQTSPWRGGSWKDLSGWVLVRGHRMLSQEQPPSLSSSSSGAISGVWGWSGSQCSFASRGGGWHLEFGALWSDTGTVHTLLLPLNTGQPPCGAFPASYSSPINEISGTIISTSALEIISEPSSFLPAVIFFDCVFTVLWINNAPTPLPSIHPLPEDIHGAAPHHCCSPHPPSYCHTQFPVFCWHK